MRIGSNVYKWLCTVALVIGTSSLVQANSDENLIVKPKRWLLLACGLPGDDEHRQRLTMACEQIIDSIDKIGVEKPNLIVLGGDEQMQQELAKSQVDTGLCNKEQIQKEINRIAEASKAEDECWIFLLGHAHLYDRASQFNVAGPDLDQQEFAKCLDRLPNVRQLVWLTFPVSGHWVKPASKPNRIVISATEADMEYTGTEMPYSLAATISGTDSSLMDIDGDGRITVLDLYVCTCVHVADQFLKEEKLQTEHSQLDDNADKRGTEVQTAYLTAKYQAALAAPAEGQPAVQTLPQTAAAIKFPAIPISADGWYSQRVILQP